MLIPVLQPLGGGWLETAGQAAVAAGSLLLVLMVVALGGYAYKQLRGDGVEWPDEKQGDEDSVQTGDTDDEWDYY